MTSSKKPSRGQGDQACHGCDAGCGADGSAQSDTVIGRRVLVMSGKGGVGKSSIATNLAVWLAMQGKSVGLLDIDIHGPSVPKLLGMGSVRLTQEAGLIVPALRGSLRVVSLGFMLQDANTPVIWRGPAKHGVIRQFVDQVLWSSLDYLVVDCPPGTGDETLSVVQVLGRCEGAIVVTTPQDVAIADVRRCLSFCRELKVPIMGVLENMSGLVCPYCGKRIDVFGSGGGEALAGEFQVPFLGGVPLDPELTLRSDAGRPIVEDAPDAPTAQAMARVFESLFDTRSPQTVSGDTR